MRLTTFVFGALPLIIQFYAAKYREEDKLTTLVELENDDLLPRIKTYDFIVVGGGTGGCVVASRLSENFSVLLLETGGHPTRASQVPFFVPEVRGDLETNYRFKSLPQLRAAQATGGIAKPILGKMLGGSGSHNGMVHNRGSPLDYDNYARILNDDSWKYSNVVKYFKKSENFIGQLFTGDHPENYGRDGPLTVDTDVPPFLEKWFDAGKELGFNIGDPNGYQVESFTPVVKAIQNGQRSSSYNQYLKPRIGKEGFNLTVLPYSYVTEVLIDENKKAYGVAYLRHSIPQIAHASKEVIISAGVYGSPLLLMRSGVGPYDQLDAAEIPVKHELPSVGENLQDHQMIILNNITYNSSAIPFVPRMPGGKDFEEMVQKYLATGEGILGSAPDGPQAFIVSSRAKGDGESSWPDIQLTFIPKSPIATGGNLPVSKVLIWTGRPKSRGNVRLNVTAYKKGVMEDTSLAEIDFKFFEDEGESDIEVLLEGIQYQLRIMNTTALQSLGMEYSEKPLPACDGHEFLTESYWRCFITQRCYPTIHGVGTCSMGSVVDSQFRVQGISNLRIADSSVFPLVPNANINAPVIMLGEKASADILKAWS